MGSRDIRGKKEKKPKKKDVKAPKSPVGSSLGVSPSPAVEVVKKKKQTWPEE